MSRDVSCWCVGCAISPEAVAMSQKLHTAFWATSAHGLQQDRDTLLCTTLLPCHSPAPLVPVFSTISPGTKFAGHVKWKCTVADTGTPPGPMTMPDSNVVRPTSRIRHRFLHGCTLERAGRDRGGEFVL